MDKKEKQMHGRSSGPVGAGPSSVADNARYLFSQAIQYHQSGNVAQAEGLYRQILSANPRNVDALHMLGVLCHQSGRPDEGEKLIRKALRRTPHPLIHTHLGNLLSETGRLDEAVAQYQMAIQLVEKSEALRSGSNANSSSSQKINQTVNTYLGIGMALLNLAVAQGTTGAVVTEAGGTTLEKAAKCFQRVLQLDPANIEASRQYGLALQELGQLDKAAHWFEKLREKWPSDTDIQMSLGDIYRRGGKFSAAKQCYKNVASARPGFEPVLARLANVQERTNDLDAARQSAELALGSNPESEGANFVIAQLDYRNGLFAQAQKRLEELRKTCTRKAFLPDIYHRLGLVYDRLGNVDSAFEAFSQANGMAGQLAAGSSLQADAERQIGGLEKLHAWLGEESLTRWTDFPVCADENRPAFLVGFPRSGTTLQDQMLNAHPGIVTVEEKPTLRRMQKDFMEKGGGLDALGRLAAEQILGYRESYFRELDGYARTQDGYEAGKALIVDKYPLHISSLLLIYRFFPDARIIVALRDPRDACLSNFMQQFELNVSMYHFLTLESAARYYSVVMGLYQRYVKTCPLAMHVVRYEELISDPKSVTQSVCEFLGVEWDEAMLNYRDRLGERAIRTPSYQQVARPLYKDAMGRWQRYGEYMRDVLPVLAPFVEAFGYKQHSGEL